MSEEIFPGYIMAMRHPDGLELVSKNPHAFILLYVIAIRARWSDAFNRHGLEPGEAFVGDYKECGLTEQNYRTAKKVLANEGFATFKPTNKGTVARIVNTRVFDINVRPSNGQTNSQPTDGQRTGNGRVTTNKKGKKDNKDNSPHPHVQKVNHPEFEEVLTYFNDLGYKNRDEIRRAWIELYAQGDEHGNWLDYRSGKPIKNWSCVLADKIEHLREKKNR